MKIRITGKIKKELIPEIREAAKFFAQELLSKRLYKKISVDIKFSKENIRGSINGICEYLDNNHRPKHFQITLNSRLTKRAILYTLAHEFVHIKQYATGEWKEYKKDTNLTKWHGKYFFLDKLDYWEYPWEIEAFGRERGLMVFYGAYKRERINNGNKK